MAGETPPFQAAFHADQRVMAERFFAGITTRRIRRGSYTSVNDPEAAICGCPGQHYTKPKPFTWTKSAEDILTR